MRKIIIAILISICFFVFADTLAITENGERVILHENGTWEYLGPSTHTNCWNYIEYVSCYYDVGKVKYRDAVKFEFSFQNMTEKEITGIEFEVKFFDAFGDEIFSTKIKDNLRIKPKELFEPSSYWYFDEYTDGYEKLFDPATNETLHTLLNVLRIAFNDGTVIKFEEKLWKEPKEGDIKKLIY